MSFKLLRQRLSISAPRMIVRSQLPWPLRWAAMVLMVGLFAAIAVWAFEFGKSIARDDSDVSEELHRLRAEVAQMRNEREKTFSIGNTAESLLKTEQFTQEKLAQQLKQAEAENVRIRSDLGFFERLLPAGLSDGLTIRGLQAELPTPGQVRFQLLVMQSGKTSPEFRGRYDITLAGTLDGKAWNFVPPGGARPLSMKQYVRVEGLVDHPPQAIVKSVSVRVTDLNGALRANLTVKP